MNDTLKGPYGHDHYTYELGDLLGQLDSDASGWAYQIGNPATAEVLAQSGGYPDFDAAQRAMLDQLAALDNPELLAP